VADKIPIKAPQDELEKKVAKGKSRNPVVDTMTKMHHIRRGQINRLLDKKNNDERDRDAEWVPVLIEKTRWSGKSILAMDVIIAKTFKLGGSGPREKRSLFVGEKSDLRVPLRSKSRDSYRDKDRFNEIRWNGRNRDRDRDRDHDQYGEPDFFAETQLFTSDGRPIDDPGRPFDGRKADRRSIPLENPIAGPIQALQPLRQAPGGWGDPPPPGPFPQDVHHNQQPMEMISGGHPSDGIVDLDQLLDKSNGGGGGYAHQNFDVDVPPVDGAGRRRSSGGSKQSRSRPRPAKIYGDQGSPRKGYRRADHYGDSSIDDPDEERSVFFDGDSGSSITSYGADHEHLIERRGSLKRRPSNRRGEHFYREHRRRPASYNPGRSGLILETARTPRRPEIERRQTIAYPVSRQIAYPYEDGGRRNVIDEPLSPVVMQQSDSPGGSRRRESRGPPPEVYYPHELGGKDRAPDDYPEPMGHDNRFREDEVRRQERGMDERDAIKGRGGSRGAYWDTRDRWDQR
jgi:hypothetical protein